MGVQDRQLVVIPGIHYFDAHRLQPDLLDTLDRQIYPESMIFSVQRLRGFRQVVTQALTCRKLN